jgi:hypothetical protein
MASEESRALFQRLVEAVAAGVRRQAGERRGEWFWNSVHVVSGLVFLWAALHLSRSSSNPWWKTAPPAQAGAQAAPAAPGLSPGIESPETFGQIPSAAMLRTRASIDEGTAKAAKARQRQFLYSAEDVVQTIADAEAKQQAFETTVQQLVANEAGKKIAATERGVPRFLALVELRRTPAARLRELSQLLETIASPVRKAHDQAENYAVPAEQQERMLATIKAEAERALVEYKDAEQSLANLSRQAARAEATPNGVNPQPAPVKSLGEEVENYRHVLQSAALEEREQQLAAERKAIEQRITDAQIAWMRAVGNAQEEEMRRKAREAEAKARAEAEAKEAEALRRRLVAKTREPKVRQMLAPFLARGLTQPKEWQGTFLAFRRTDGEEPMSLSALRSVKALEPGTEGLASLAWVAGDTKNDRSPRWDFGHVNSWPKETHRYVAQVQELLRELGDVLVTEGMLAK